MPLSHSITPADRQSLAARLTPGAMFHTPPLPLAAQAWLAADIARAYSGLSLWVLDGPQTLERFFQNLMTFAGGPPPPDWLLYPERETARRQPPDGAPESAGRQFAILRCLPGMTGGIVATCVQALLQPVPAPLALTARILHVRAGHAADLHQLAAELQTAGYLIVPEVQMPGEAALRGGLLDVWPPAGDWPLRLEFFGRTLESIRTFHPEDQRSRETLDSVHIVPVVAGSGAALLTAHLPDYLPAPLAVFWSDPDVLDQAASVFTEALKTEPPDSAMITLPELRAGWRKISPPAEGFIGRFGAGEGVAWPLDVRPLPGIPVPEGLPFEPDAIRRLRRQYVTDLMRSAAAGAHAHLFFHTDGSRRRFEEDFADLGAGFKKLQRHTGFLTEGFQYPAGNLSVVSENEIYGGPRAGQLPPERRRGRTVRKPTALRVADWTDIQPGDLVVHIDHGIGKYLGMREIAVTGRPHETLAVEYAGGAKIYVPAHQAHLLSRYIGVGRVRPELHSLGGVRWNREKTAAQRAIRDLAVSMLETQAARETQPGHAFAPDHPWQHEFEGTFPFQETEDQARAILEVKHDMERPRPMDRLLCGDVGYGKTEVAMRAAFKAVMDGRQVALLVPTTILAQQHYETFKARMTAFPVTVDMLSRFRSRSEQDRIVARAAEGAVDILIGTHRLIQPDVRFKNLGLVIIDEEQRFGVAHKERLKDLRSTVDVLTMTATPIPRTLNLSLMGLKDLSTIQTPPQERLPIETIVAPFSEDLVRQAVLRELAREGQVFYLHNRVHSIERAASRLRQIVPEARIAVAHGQMAERELAAIMHRFIRRDVDVLLCTTIIESGVDIPNVNTILIEHADRFGLADLYQLRGRVGRYKHHAHAYLLLPRHGRLFDTARQRIQALRRHSGLGSGFKLALQDLEIRGSGNILGAQQSGHIAAVGFDLYCNLLRRTVAHLQGDEMPPLKQVDIQLDFLDWSMESATCPPAALPYAYIEDENHRVQIYRRIASCATEKEIKQCAAELRDRFGPLPAEAERLLTYARLRVRAAAAGVQALRVTGDKIFLTRGNDIFTDHGRIPVLRQTEANARMEELLKFVAGFPPPSG